DVNVLPPPREHSACMTARGARAAASAAVTALGEKRGGLGTAPNYQRHVSDTDRLRGWGGKTRTRKCVISPGRSYVLEISRQLAPSSIKVRPQRPDAAFP